MKTTHLFTWRPTYKALVDWLLGQEANQPQLISLLQNIGIEGGMYDRDERWEYSQLNEIDPFTFFSYLNKFGDNKRLDLLVKLHQQLNFQCEPPRDVHGLPTCNPMKVWLFPYKPVRGASDIADLWQMFRQTVDGNIDEKLLKKVLAIRSVGKGKMSINWFYTNPDRYLTLDSRTCSYLRSKNLEFVFDTFAQYKTIIERAKTDLGKSFVEISYDAWQYTQQIKQEKGAVAKTKKRAGDGPEVQIIGSVSGLLDLIFIENEMDVSVDQARLFYRGHASTNFELKPSIYRSVERINNEDTIFKEMEHSVPHEFAQCTCTFDKLVKMQHYELPTRLLDITSNPLVALYFACVDKDFKDQDGELYQFEIDNEKKELLKYADSDAISVVANIARRPISFAVDELEDVAHLYHDIRFCDKPAFESCIDPKDFERVFFVTPKKNNSRIIKQEGAFFLFGVDKIKGQCLNFEKGGFFPFKKYVIPCEAKKKIEKELNILGINQASLFPEIDKVALHIKRNYS